MKKHSITYIFSLFLLLKTIDATAQYDELVIFGDSLSDTGNLTSTGILELPSQIYYKGSRLSNGPVAVEQLAKLLGLSAAPSMHLIGKAEGTNFSVSGATANTYNGHSLESQVEAYLTQNQGTANTEALYIIFIGGNDLREARDRGQEYAREIIHSAIEAIDAQVNLLIALGAEKIMVVNAPNVKRVPETRNLAEYTGDTTLLRMSTLYTKYFNAKLAKKMARIRHKTEANLTVFDFYRFHEKLFKNASSYAYKNITEACFNLLDLTFNPACAAGRNVANFLFFDDVHPTARTHDRIARAMYSVVPE